MLGRFLYHLLHGPAAAAGKFVNVAATGLYAAIVAATPGTVITETGGPGAPVALSFTNLNIADPGIAVVLDPAQVVTLKTTGVTGGMAYYSGIFQADSAGNETGSNNYAVNLTSGANRIALRGNRFGQSVIHVTGVGVTDLDIDSADFEDTRNDFIQLIDVQRLRINNIYAGTIINTAKFCYYDNGDPPQLGLAERDCDDPAHATVVGHWLDTSHSDTAQIRGQNTVNSDITITGNTIFTSAEGFNDFGAVQVGSPAQQTQRVRVWDNSLTVGVNPLRFVGQDLDYRRNTTARYPGVDYFKTNIIGFPDPAAQAAGGHRIQGYGNSADVYSPGTGGSAPIVPVSLGGATLSGSPDVVPPELPRIAFPAWFPAVPARPAPPVITALPRPVDGLSLQKTGNPIAGTTWFTIYGGKWRDVAGITYEWRFKLNGVVVPGCAQVCQAPAGNAGAALTGEARGTTAVGTSVWYATPPVTLQ